MDIHDARRQLRTKSIYEIPLRVTYYARVSSESDEQLNSLGNQIKYYEDFIRRSAAWEFVPGYIDEGLSGISTKRRENFKKMSTIRTMSFVRRSRTSLGHEVGVTYVAVLSV